MVDATKVSPDPDREDRVIVQYPGNNLGGYANEVTLPIPYDVFNKEYKRAIEAHELPSFTDEKIPLIIVAHKRGLYDQEPANENVSLDALKIEQLKSRTLIEIAACEENVRLNNPSSAMGASTKYVLAMAEGERLISSLVEMDEKLCEMNVVSDVSYYKDLPTFSEKPNPGTRVFYYEDSRQARQFGVKTSQSVASTRTKKSFDFIKITSFFLHL